VPAHPLDLGPVGNLTWRHFPETREVIKGLVSDALDLAILQDTEPGRVESYEYFTHAVNPLFVERLGFVDLDPDLVRRLGAFCRDLLAYAGPEVTDVRYSLHMYLVDGLDEPPSIDALRRVDPELVELIGVQFPGRWSGAS
jgi:hypothetical protein